MSFDDSRPRRSLKNTFNRLSASLIGSARRKASRTQRVAVVINPASGPDRPLLKIFNSVFGSAGVDWDIYLTCRPGDGLRQAQRALIAGADVVAAYGGDGTVSEVAGALVGSSVPLGVLPGGTTNMIAISLGIPRDLAQACTLLTGESPLVRDVYLGRVNQTHFFQMIGIGLEARIIEATDRATKDRLGLLAYGIKALNVLGNAPVAKYHLDLDGKQVDAEGVTCFVLNADNLGIPYLSGLAPGRRAGLLDVYMVTRADLGSLLSLATTVTGWGINMNLIPHWQAHDVTIMADPVQPFQRDGDLLGETPVQIHSLTKSIGVIVPQMGNLPPVIEPSASSQVAGEEKPTR